METLVGNQRFTDVGNILPTGTPIRVYAIDLYSTVSSTGITLHNGIVSSTTTTIYLVVNSDADGTAHESWSDGIYFPTGVWIDTKAAGAIIGLISYSTVKA